MQTPGHFIRIFIEFTSGMQYGHNHFQSRFILFGMACCRNTPTVISHRDRVIFVYSYLNMITKSSQSLVYRVVYDLVNQMVQPFDINVSDIHGGTHPHCLQTFQYLNTIGGILSFVFLNLFAHIIV